MEILEETKDLFIRVYDETGVDHLHIGHLDGDLISFHNHERVTLTEHEKDLLKRFSDIYCNDYSVEVNDYYVLILGMSWEYYLYKRKPYVSPRYCFSKEMGGLEFFNSTSKMTDNWYRLHIF